MRLITLLVLTVLAPLAAAQQALTTERVGNFIDSLGEVTGYTDSLDDEVATGALSDEVILPRPGTEFGPYTRAMEYLQEGHTDVYDELNAIVADYGFASAGNWAQTGDRVAIAYMAMQMEGTDMQQVTPEMLNQVPPAMRPQIEQALAIMETVRNAPAADIEAVRPLAGRLQEHMGQMQQ